MTEIEIIAESAPRIIVVGSTMTDMVTYATKLPEAGETLVGDRFVMGFGGKGANQAVMASRFGAKVSMVTCVGDDLFGKNTIENFVSQGVDASHIKIMPGSSGIAPIWVDGDGNNRILIIPGANNLLTPSDASSALEEISDGRVVIGQLEIPQAVTAKAFEIAKSKGMVTIFNPAPYLPIDNEILKNTDWLIPNESEFSSMHPTHAQPEEASILELQKTLGVRLVVTLGDKGVAFINNAGKYQTISAPKVKAVDTTGAGDAFIGAFAYGIAVGLSEEQALTLGCHSATLSVTRTGTQSSYPDKSEAQKLLSERI